MHSIISLVVATIAAVAVEIPCCQSFTIRTTTSLHPQSILSSSPHQCYRYSHTSSTRLRPSSPSPWSQLNHSTPATPPPPPPPPPSSPPPQPKLKRIPLPVALAGGLFLFATSVPPSQKKFARKLLALSEETLRSDPTIAMELGMGIEAGGVFASSYIDGAGSDGADALWGERTVDRLVLQFQINGGATWAQGVAYGVQDRNDCGEDDGVTLLALEVANMDAVLNGQSFQVPL
mmetsp:Transcript_38947/g.83903  ORF Transcript_38947/g.83903 Transcript_38947/m.83903 type:complete len:233 (+) Transcript_38947:96-794(+)